MAHADLAHKYDFGPGRECVHWEARRKQRTVDKREEAMQQLNTTYDESINDTAEKAQQESDFRPNEKTQEELTKQYKLINPKISGLERSTGQEGSPWSSKVPKRLNNNSYTMQW